MPLLPHKKTPAGPQDKLPRMFVAGLVLTAILGLVLPTAASVGPRLEAGCRLLGQGELDRAAAQFAAAYAEDSRCGEAQAGLGVAHLLRGDGDQAVADFQAAAALDPTSSLGRLGLAAAYCQLGEHRLALSTYEGLLLTTLTSADRIEVTAAIAYLQSRQGLYDSALASAGQALQEDPCHSLARYAQAASLLARQQLAAAARATEEPLGNLTLCGLLVGDCLFAPQAYYARAHQLAQIPPPPIPTPPPSPAPPPPESARRQEFLHQEPDFQIARPQHCSAVSGRLHIRLDVKATLEISHISVLLGDNFVGMSNKHPFDLFVMTTNCPDGWQALRVDAYDRAGHLVRSASVGVVVENGNRTLAPGERQARRTAAELLRPYLFLQPQPGLWEHLRGCIYQAQRDHMGAIASYEAAFARSPELPRLRDDLLAAYQHLNIPTKSSPSEMHQLPREQDAVALTFDDGPHPKVTPWILDHLDRVGAKATFFLVGKQVDLYPELAREIVRRGHQVGSHSYTHRNMRQLSPLEIERELVRSRAAIRRATGVSITLFRPPGGNYNETVRQATGLWGYTTVFWTANISDYPGASPGQVKAKLFQKIAPGSIVLLHNGEDETVDVLPDLLDKLRDRGMKMIALPGPEPHLLAATGKGVSR